ncbi:MAG: hypothetical protein IKB98_03465 [Clostridia bacterium]|nr:hypothetical protein [Clostridia bacterium]
MKFKSKNLIFSIFFIFIILLSCFSLGLSQVKAESSSGGNYSTALEDLKAGEGFSEEDFPAIDNDYSIQVITIAESQNKELFIYVYQPSSNFVEFTACSINLSTETGEDIPFKNYKLELLNREGVFQKYLVKNFEVKSDAIRYYNISSIYRPWDKMLDDAPADENILTEVAFEVGKLFKATTKNGKVSYVCQETETILITSRVDGFVEYSDGFTLFPSWCRSHYVAFSAEYDIEHLLEADVYYIPVDVSYTWLPFFGEDITRKVLPEEYVKLTYKQSVSHEGSGWFSKTYTWDRIESVKDFVANENLTDEAKADLLDKQWVLRFVETEYKHVDTAEGFNRYYTDITDVTILRLKFETEGKTYNLGVVDNKQYQPGTAEPDNKGPGEDLGCTSFDIKTFLIIVGIILALILFMPILPDVIRLAWFLIKYGCKALFYIIKYLIKGLYYLFAWPFYLAKWIKERKE